MGLGALPHKPALGTALQFKCHLSSLDLLGRQRVSGFLFLLWVLSFRLCGPHYSLTAISGKSQSIGAIVDCEFSPLHSQHWKWSIAQGLGGKGIACLKLLSVPLLHPVWGGRRLQGRG